MSEQNIKPECITFSYNHIGRNFYGDMHLILLKTHLDPHIESILYADWFYGIL